MSKRFDISEASKLQSRDGGITKGGLVRNGFVETNKAGRWNWQRPALGSGAAAPFSGRGLGLYIVGTGTSEVLWGLFHAGTGAAVATSGAVTLGANNITWNAQDVLGGIIYGYEGVYYNQGSISPTSWFGRPNMWLYVNTSGSGYTELGLLGSSASGKSALQILSLNGTAVTGVAAATFTVMLATQGTTQITVSNWTWPGYRPITGTGIYTGFFT